MNVPELNCEMRDRGKLNFSVAGLEGKTAFITGAVSEIGRATLIALACRGANIVAVDRSESGVAGGTKIVQSEYLRGRLRPPPQAFPEFRRGTVRCFA